MTFLLFLVVNSAASTPADLSLLSRMPVSDISLNISGQQRQWLKQHATLKVAVWGAPQPPVYMGLDPATFEGLAADYLEAIKNILKVEMAILHYPDRQSAINALNEGSVDMLAFYHPASFDTPSVQVSDPWLLDYPVVVMAKDTTVSLLHGSDAHIAYTGNEQAVDLLHRQFPSAHLTVYSGYSSATAAVAYGQEDAFWLNSATANFMINAGYGSLLNRIPLAFPDNLNLSFAVSRDNPHLLHLLNRSLRSIPFKTRARMASIWGLDVSYVSKNNPLALTEEELAWLKQHPVVNVYTSGAFAPFLFIDSEYRQAGLAISLLEEIADVTGIKLNYQHFGSIELMQSQLKMASDALTPAMIVKNPPENTLLFSRSYARVPWVLVTNKDQSRSLSLDSMSKGRVALSATNGITAELKNSYPHLQFIETQNTAKAMDMLHRGGVEAVVAAKPSADYLLTHFFQDSLRIGNVVPVASASIAFALPYTNPLLLGIINKGLATISPMKIQHDIEHWQNADVPLQANSWSDYRDYIVNTVIGAALIVLFFLIRNRYLQKIILQRKRYESQLENQLQFSRTLIDKSPVALYVRDKELRMLNCNDTYLQFLGLEAEQVMGKVFCESPIFHGNYHRQITETYQEVLTSDRPLFVTMAVMINQRTCHLYHWTLPYHDHQGKISGIIGGFLDITERHLLLEQVQQAKEVADRASKSKSIFLAQMSHEIRTPMNALIGLLEMEHRKIIPPEQRDANIAVAWNAANSLLSLVSDILDLAKIEAGNKKVRFEPVSLTDIIQSVSALFAHDAMEKQLLLGTTLELTHPLVNFEPVMFRQIVSNLVSNAIKYTESGNVEIALYQAVEDGQNWGNYTLEVCDSGIGLSAHSQTAIFEPFVQVEGVSQPVKSTGLGLNICQQLAKALGGTLTVESEPGKGSTFIFRFRAEFIDCLQEEELQQDLIPDSESKNILIVDDNAANRLLLSQQLEYAGHSVIAVETGEQALLSWDREKPRFDVVITDCNMPGISGFSLIERLRKKERLEGLPTRPMFGLTAMSEQEVTERAKRAGMTKCLFKPIDLDTLLRQISTDHVALPALMDPLSGIKYLSAEDRADFVNSYVETNRQDISKLKALIASLNFHEIKKMAHRMRGSSAIINAQELGAILKDLELAAENEDEHLLPLLFSCCEQQINMLSYNMHMTNIFD